MCFYLAAALGVPWSILWLLVATSTPAPGGKKAKTLEDVAAESGWSGTITTDSDTDSNGSHIASEVGGAKVPTPWREILLSPGMNAGYVTNFGCGWVFYMLLTFLPQYLEQRFHFKLGHSGVIGTLPYIGRGVVLIGGGIWCDRMLRKGTSLLRARQVFNTLASVGPSVFLIVVTFGNNSDIDIAMIIVAVMLSGFQMAGCVMIPIDLFPEAVGVAYGLGNLVGNVPGIVAPALTGKMLDNAGCPSGDGSNSTGTITQECIDGWDRCIYLSAAICAVGGIFFLVVAPYDKRYQNHTFR
jgi:sugar phosphate permease